MEKIAWSYSGPVKIFDRIVSEKWEGSTLAVSEEKAKANLEYQYKKQHGYILSSKIKLVGSITRIL